MIAHSKGLFSNRKLISMLIPVIMESVMASLVGMVDGVMVSSVGEAAISGVALIGNLNGVMVQLFACLSAGGAIVTSQFIGARKIESARHSTGQLILMALTVSSFLAVFALTFARPLLMFCFGKTEPEVMDNAVIYFKILAFSYPFLALRGAGGAIFRCSGNTKVSLYVSLVVNAVNIAGNAVCIYGLGMGVEGVAIPTLLSRMVGAGMVMLLMNRSQKIVRPAWSDVTHIHKQIIAKIFRLGMPTALEGSLFQLGKVGTLSMISGFGTYQIAANSIGGTLSYFSGIPSEAAATVAMTVVGQCVGAKEVEQIKSNTRKLMLWAHICTSVVAVVMILLRYQILGLYVSLSPEGVELTANLMLLYLSVAPFLYPPSFFIRGPLRAANDSMYTMLVGVLSMMVLRLGIAYVLCVVMEMGVVGVWIAMVIDWVNRTAWFGGRYLSGAWKKKCGMA